MASPQDQGGSAGLPSTVTAPPVPPRSLPHWVSRPSGDDVAAVYPRRAQFMGVSGRAVMRCHVTANGEMQGCAIVEEDPSGEGFGSAELALAKYFKMSKYTINGAPVAGSVVTIPVRFQLSR